MTPPLDTWSPKRRRTLLRVLGGAVSATTLHSTFETSAAESGTSVVMEQGDRCVEFTALEGDVPVEELYDFTYPMDQFAGSPGSQGSTYSSMGTTDLQRDRSSILFLYDGPQGLSLVIVHGHLNGDRDAGGTVTFTFYGLPGAATWVVRDDHYVKNGEPVASNYDNWNITGDPHVVDWAYRGGRTDGGVIRGLGSDFEITIEPRFNDNAALSADHDYGPIEAWEMVAGDRTAPDRFPLRLDLPVTIRTGTCGESTDDPGTTNNGEPTNADKNHGKHERKQQKHQEKHQRKQEKHQRKQQKHQEKHRRKQRKHQEKHQRKQQKHQEKHQKKQRKHQKHGG